MSHTTIHISAFTISNHHISDCQSPQGSTMPQKSGISHANSILNRLGVTLFLEDIFQSCWQPILADFMPTEDLGNQFLLILCFIPNNRGIIIHSCIIPIFKKYHSCHVPKSIVLVSFQFQNIPFHEASFLFCSNSQNVSFLLCSKKHSCFVPK